MSVRVPENDPTAALAALSKEARGEMPPVDWARVDERLFARIEREGSGIAAALDTVEPEAPPRFTRLLVPVGFALAAAAAAALVVSGDHGSSRFEPRTVTASAPAGTLRELQGDGVVADRVSGASLTPGSVATLGETLESHGARAFFERRAPGATSMDLHEAGAVAWSLEPEARVTVTRTNGALVLRLDEGAVEAQVAPVPSGEAFAVDVGPTRVAVHGTHLRVARDGEKVLVDLSEGVVSIGAPPRSGSTYGDLVTAPAHVEFVPGKLTTTLVVDHAPASVRDPVDLHRATALVVVPATPPEPVAPPELPPAPPVVATASVPRAQVTTRPAAPPAPRPAETAETSEPAPAAVPPALPPVDPNAEGTVLSAVTACLGAQPLGRDVQKVTVSSVLELSVDDQGFAHTGRFVPPLADYAQSCASEALWKVRFPHSGRIVIPIHYER